MKYVIITGATHLERHPIDNDVIEYAARLTAYSHNQEFPADEWVVTIEDDEAPQEK